MKTKRKKLDPIERAISSPVGRAMALRGMRADMLDMGLACLAVEHGTEQRELLAKLAFMIGIGAEVAAVAKVLGDNQAGLHQSLAEVVRMASDGCRWNADWAAQLQLALDVSAEVMMENAHRAMQVLPGARALADDIRAGRVHPDVLAPLVMPGHYKEDSSQRLTAEG